MAWPINLISFLAVYLPVEDFLLKWVPVSEPAYLLLRQIPDLVVAVLFLSVLVGHGLRVGSRYPVIGSGADKFLVGFIFLALLSIPLNSANSVAALSNIKALLRYVLLIYTILILNPSDTDIRRFARALWAGVVVQILVGMVQWLGGIPVRDFLAARNTSDDIAGIRRVFTGTMHADVNDLFGTMGSTINFAMFMLVGLVVWLVTKEKQSVRLWGGTVVLVAMIYLSGSRSVLLASIFVIVVFNVLRYGRRAMVYAIFGAMIATAVLALVTQGAEKRDLTYIFTESYVQIALNQRLGLLVYVLPIFFSDIRTFFGFSPDKNIFIDFVRNDAIGVPSVLRAVLPSVIEDVYWFALLCYYGILGLACIGLFVLAVARRTSAIYLGEKDAFGKQLALASYLLLFASLPLNLFNQAFEVRQYSYYLWTFVGLSLAYSRRARVVSVAPN